MLELAIIIVAGALLYMLLKPPAAHIENAAHGTSVEVEQPRAEMSPVERILSPVERIPSPLTGASVVRHDAIGDTKR